MRINTNILSLSAQRNLGITTRALARAMEKLASGSRINSARDDAAGLAIGAGLEAQRRGMTQAIRNMNEARGFLNTAEGGLAEQTNIVQRMRELALQSANGTNSNTDRGYLDNEFQQLLLEFERISNQTEFNGTKLLDGSRSQFDLQVGTQKAQSIRVQLPTLLSKDIFPSSASSTETRGSGTFTQAASVATTNNNHVGETADMNGDGKIDLIISSNNMISIHLGNGNGTFQSQSTIGFSGQNNDLQIFDLNQDGAMDIITVHGSSNFVGIYLGNGNGTFQSQTTFDMVGTTFEVTFGDTNQDGYLDMLTTQYSPGMATIKLGNGDGTFQASTTLSVGNTSSTIELGDFNADGKLDFATTYYSGNRLQIFLGNGNGTFVTGSSNSTSTNPSDVVARDLNNDSILDIVTADYSSNVISVFFGNGNGTFQNRITYAVGASPYDLEFTDLNSDGSPDIIVANNTGATASILINNGDGTFMTSSTLGADGNPISTLAADLNGDTVDDIIIVSGNAVSTRVYLSNTEDITLSESVEINILSQEAASDMLTILDSALSDIGTARSNIGAIQNRLDYAESNSRTMVENISSAKSQITDTDFASELAEFTRLQILQEAGLSVLSQANMTTQLALKLLQNI